MLVPGNLGKGFTVMEGSGKGWTGKEPIHPHACMLWFSKMRLIYFTVKLSFD